jgi:uncharacterized FAD-dependent dehydrogenase
MMNKETVVAAFAASVFLACVFTYNCIIVANALPLNRNWIMVGKGIISSSTNLHLFDGHTGEEEPSIVPAAVEQSGKDSYCASSKETSRKDEMWQRWRIFDVHVHPNSLVAVGKSSVVLQQTPEVEKRNYEVSSQSPYFTSTVLDALLTRLNVRKLSLKPYQKKFQRTSDKDKSNNTTHPVIKNVKVVRRSLDARKVTCKKSSDGAPIYNYVIDFDIMASTVKRLGLHHQPGRMEVLLSDSSSSSNNSLTTPDYNPLTCTDESLPTQHHGRKPTVVIVGAGPAGLFCAIELAKTQLVTPIVLERGQPVESRGRDIGSLIHRRSLNTESNFAFGEGGAGTWSDGKLTTRIGRNSLDVRRVLQTFVQYGAPESILVEGSPHLGTDNLVRLIKKMRQELRALGGEVRFGARVTNIHQSGGAVTGVKVMYGDTATMERFESNLVGFHSLRSGSTETIEADAVVLATGHSARDIFQELASMGVNLEPKGFAVGFRVEHPQSLINKIQYGTEWAPSVVTGKAVTDIANRRTTQTSETFSVPADGQPHVSPPTIHPGHLPVASYRLATNEAFDGSRNRGVYSFCMCPGGQIVPASTNPEECCVNGMSFSRRDSLWANSALVVTIDPNDPILTDYISSHGILAGVAFQQDMERRAAKMGGGSLVVPVQRITDFLQDTSSTSAPPSSYRLGVKPSPVHDIYCTPIVNALKYALVHQFDRQMPGFLCEEGLLHAVETRTSSPLRISRDPESMQAIGIRGLFPSGEGAGFAGGIVSAAVDGMLVAEAVIDNLFEGISSSRSRKSRQRSLNFDY